ncbi:MAG TPA: tetratricopeptide repeat protein, partial [Gemmatimonadota bacterium]|nr:tetratricopeptide repeat protein [Gemmatimonadota bacterium]
PARSTPRAVVRWTAVAGFATAALAGPAAGQETRGALEEARRLRNAGELDLAATVLGHRLSLAPDDVDARWLLAQTLYWMGDVAAARAEYARALARRPGDAGLRLDYARFLIDTGRAGEAKGVLAPLAERAPPGWEPEVRRVERTILAATAPWARVAPSARDDSQPLTRMAIEAEAGFWPADGLSLAVRVTPQRYEGELEIFGESHEVTATEAVAAVAYAPAGSPVAVEVSAGVATRDRPETTDAIVDASVAVRLPRGIALRGGGSRQPYLWTVSSLARDVRVDGLEVALDRSGAPRWAFEAGARRETFDLGEGLSEPGASGRDDNAVTSAWAWMLAPLWIRDRASLRAGYAFQWQDSEESRFAGEGTYDPYYTPEEVRVHSVVAAVALRPSPDVSIHADGAVGLAATERAPQAPPIIGPADPPGPGLPGAPITFVDRDFTPWRARATLVAALGATGELRAEVERNEGAFFEMTRGEVSLTWRLGR